ncbi:Putative uncharacterized protein Yba2 [Buchnera aphidicola (Takecallis arundicolens)]|uniref:DUF2076 domain-containing protein n=1 Tax=Buchnera aphidicola TaxID=9 RepID=UPI003464D898
MKETEKTLIINLFKKINNISLQTPHKDSEAEKLINILLKNQHDSVYYMVQTLLVQDILIQELNDKVKKLQDRISRFSVQNMSFLSDHVKQKVRNLPTDNHILHNSNKNTYSKKVEPEIAEYNYSNSNNTSGSNPRRGISSFLGTAIQTAVGVAGGMVAGNMLTNFLHNHEKESHILDDSNHVDSSTEHLDPSINNFFQVDDTHENLDTDDLDDVHDFDENFTS